MVRPTSFVFCIFEKLAGEVTPVGMTMVSGSGVSVVPILSRVAEVVAREVEPNTVSVWVAVNAPPSVDP